MAETNGKLTLAKMKLATRKFMSVMIVIVISYIALWGGKIDGDQYSQIVLFALGIFATANVAAKHKSFNEGA